MNRANDGFTVRGPARSYPGSTVDIDPVDGKNLAGEAQVLHRIVEAGQRQSVRVPEGTEVLDDDHMQFNFGRMADRGLQGHRAQ